MSNLPTIDDMQNQQRAIDHEAYEQRQRRYSSMPSEMHQAIHMNPACGQLVRVFMDGKMGYLEMLEQMIVQIQKQNESILLNADNIIRQARIENLSKEITS